MDTKATQKQRHPEPLILHVSKLPVILPRCVELRRETRHHFQPRHKHGVEAPDMGDGHSQKTTMEVSLIFNFHHLHKPPPQGAAAAAGWAGREGDALGRGRAWVIVSLARRLRKQHWHQLQELSLPNPSHLHVPGKTAGSQGGVRRR